MHFMIAVCSLLTLYAMVCFLSPRKFTSNRSCLMSDEWLGEEPHKLIARLQALAVDLERVANGKQIRLSGEPVWIDDYVLFRRAAPCLVGRMTGHPTVGDGRLGATTELFYLDERLGIARTLNRWYRLKRPGSESQYA